MFSVLTDKINQCAERIKLGEIGELDKLFALTYGRLKFYAESYLADKGDADDVVNETYIAFCENLEHLDTSSNVLNWMIKVVKNKALNRNRRSVRQVGMDPEAMDALAATDPMSEREDSMAIRGALSRLSKDEQELFRLYFVEEKTVRSIAVVLGLKKSAVAERINKLREKLKNLLF